MPSVFSEPVDPNRGNIYVDNPSPLLLRYSIVRSIQTTDLACRLWNHISAFSTAVAFSASKVDSQDIPIIVMEKCLVFHNATQPQFLPPNDASTSTRQCPIFLSSLDWRQPRKCAKVSRPDKKEPSIEESNDRYPCQAGIISNSLACGTVSRSSAHLKDNATILRNSMAVGGLLAKKHMTTLTLTIISTATLAKFPIQFPPTAIPSPTLAVPTGAIAVVNPVVTAVVQTTSAVSAFRTSGVTRLPEPDLVLAVGIGLSVPCIALVVILLGILTWREREVRRDEERAAKNQAMLQGRSEGASTSVSTCGPCDSDIDIEQESKSVVDGERRVSGRSYARTTQLPSP